MRTVRRLVSIALLVGAELVVRVFFARSMAGRFDYGYHPTAGFVERADGTVRLTKMADEDTVCQGRAKLPNVYGMPIDKARKALAAADVIEMMSRQGVEASYLARAPFAEQVRRETATWAQVVREAKIRMD